jgi:hypothetical protein
MVEPWKGGPWQPGQSGNPDGRPPGKPNAKTIELRRKLEGKADSLELLSVVVASTEAPLPSRIAAAAALARYQHPPAPRYLKHKIDLPVATTVAQAMANIAILSSLAAQRRIGLDEMGDLIAAQRTYIEMQTNIDLVERVTILEQRWERDPIVPPTTIVGGLPPLPLAESDGPVIMPQLSPPRDPPPTTDGDAS